MNVEDIHTESGANALILCKNPGVRPFVEGVLDHLLRRYRPGERVDLDDIAEAIGQSAVTYDEVELLISRLEESGRRVGEPLNAHDVGVVRSVIVAAHKLRAQLRRPPTVAEISLDSGHAPHIVRRALELGRGAAKFRHDGRSSSGSSG